MTPPKHTTCGKCEHYSRSLGRCKFGKANPRTKKATREAMMWMGSSYICFRSKWKIKVFNEIYSGDFTGDDAK
jgi:hypothetical protein